MLAKYFACCQILQCKKLIKRKKFAKLREAKSSRDIMGDIIVTLGSVDLRQGPYILTSSIHPFTHPVFFPKCSQLSDLRNFAILLVFSRVLAGVRYTVMGRS